MGLLEDHKFNGSDGESEYTSSTSSTSSTGSPRVPSSTQYDSPAQFTFSSSQPQLALASKQMGKLWGRACSAPWRMLPYRLLVFLIPSFLHGRLAREQVLRPAHKITPTAYLDGMRGVAALFVYFCHYSYQAFTIAPSWGYAENWSILKLPILRLWYQGPTAVCVFFVISGYALSYKPLKLIRARSMDDFATTMSSLTFRRVIRLYLPTAASTLMVVCLLQLGVYEWTRDFANDQTYMKNIVEPHPERLEGIYVQLVDWVWKMFEFIHVFDWNLYGGQPSYDVHLWTIPVEFRCSMFLFLVIVGTGRLQTKMRFLVVGGVFYLVYRNSRWDMALFLCGMLIAEMDHIRGAHKASPALPVDEEQKSTPRSSLVRLKSVFWTCLSIVGLYLLSQPDDHGEETPGWVFLTSIVPKWWEAEQFRYWQSAGAVVFVFAVGHSPTWQRFFTTGPVQYLGKISYALYLMHAPAMHCMGYHWEKWAYSVTGVDGLWFNAGFILGACLCVPTVIWWADVFWRAVDIPAVKIAKWFEEKCVVKSEE